MTESNNILSFIGKILEKRGEGKVRRGDYVIAIVVNAILLYVFNNLLNWNIYFITDALNGILWIINISIIAIIILNILQIFYNPLWFRNLMKIFSNIFVFIIIYMLYTVFPISFNIFYVDISLKFVFLVTLIVIFVLTVIEAVLMLILIIKKLKDL
jgi:hypothetical protein